jgi:hypothetical protein
MAEQSAVRDEHLRVSADGVRREHEVTGEAVDVHERGGHRSDGQDQPPHVVLIVYLGNRTEIALDDRVEVACEEPRASDLRPFPRIRIATGGHDLRVGRSADPYSRDTRPTPVEHIGDE